jgi:branched-chain amino acid transport system substrate-binding protein
MKSVGHGVLAAALVAMFGIGTAVAQDKETLRIVSQSPLSGPQSVAGEAIKLGAQLAVEDYAKEVTSLGFQLALQPEDDQANPDVGVSNANRIINDPNILGVVAHYNSGVAIPSSEVYAKVGLVMVSPAATNPAITDRDTTRAIANRICGRDDIQGPAGADFATTELKAKKVYVINDKSAYGSGIASAFEAELKKQGVTVAFSTGIDQNETDFSSILNRALIDKPDVIFYGGTYPQGGLLIKQVRQRHLNATILGGDGMDSGDLQKIAGSENMAHVYFTTTSVPLSKLPSAGAFLKEYQTRFNKAPQGYSAYGYDSAHALIEGIVLAIKANGGKKPTREQVAAAVRGEQLNGLTGQIAFNSHGDVRIAKYIVVAAGDTYEKNDVKKVLSVAAPTN